MTMLDDAYMSEPEHEIAHDVKTLMSVIERLHRVDIDLLPAEFSRLQEAFADLQDLVHDVGITVKHMNVEQEILA